MKQNNNLKSRLIKFIPPFNKCAWKFHRVNTLNTMNKIPGPGIPQLLL